MFPDFCGVQDDTQYPPFLTHSAHSIRGSVFRAVSSVLVIPSATDPHIRSGSMCKNPRPRLLLCCPRALASAFGPSVPPSAALWGPGTALEHLVNPRIAGSGVIASRVGGVTLPVLADPPCSCSRQRAHFIDFSHMKKHRCQSRTDRFSGRLHEAKSTFVSPTTDALTF